MKSAGRSYALSLRPAAVAGYERPWRGPNTSNRGPALKRIGESGGSDGSEMRITDILPVERIYVDTGEGSVRNKADALKILAGLLATGLGCDGETIRELFAERERLQSTGIGDGVAIPHTSLEAATRRAAALVLSNKGLPFDAIDGADVHIVLGVIGPKDATGEHLRVLARVSRLLRDESTRRALSNATSPQQAFGIIEAREQQLG
jgi:PTS system nitrogen regulatory IIA component